MLFIYVISAIMIVAFVLAFLTSEYSRPLLEMLGLWEKMQAIDGNALLHWMCWLGEFLLIIAAILAGSVFLGYHPSIWYVPAAQTAIFGLILWLFCKPDQHDQ